MPLILPEAVSPMKDTVIIPLASMVNTQSERLNEILIVQFGFQIEPEVIKLLIIGVGCLLVIIILSLMLLMVSGGPKKLSDGKAKDKKSGKKAPSVKTTLVELTASEVVGTKHSSVMELGDERMTLSSIETEMLALKELYSSGHINADVYVAETRILYEKAQTFS